MFEENIQVKERSFFICVCFNIEEERRVRYSAWNCCSDINRQQNTETFVSISSDMKLIQTRKVKAA